MSSSSPALQSVINFFTTNRHPQFVADSVKVNKIANLLKSVPVIGCGSTALYIIAFAISISEDDKCKNLMQSSLKIVSNFLIFVNVICRCKVIIN
jgi:hypothetical protein